MIFNYRKLDERGDTLVEVTIALAILSLVMISAFLTATNAFRLGQTARERSQLVSAAQLQADALKSFRDSHTWHQFYYGNTGVVGPACDHNPTSYCGIDSGGAGWGGDCDPTTAIFDPCFHMELRTITESAGLVTEWVPVHGRYTGTALIHLPGTGFVSFTTTAPYSAAINAEIDFSLRYGNTTLGQTAADTTNTNGFIAVRLANLESFH